MIEHLLTVTPPELIAAVDSEITKGNARRQFGVHRDLDDKDSEILNDPGFFATVSHMIADFYEGYALSRKEIDELAIAYFMYLGMTSPDFPISDDER